MVLRSRHHPDSNQLRFHALANNESVPAPSAPNPAQQLLNHGSSTGRHHEHAVSLAKDLVVQVHPDHGVATCFLRALLKLSQGDVSGSLQLTLIGGRPSANKVADAGKHVLEEVGAKYRFTGDDSTVWGDAPRLRPTRKRPSIRRPGPQRGPTLNSTVFGLADKRSRLQSSAMNLLRTIRVKHSGPS